MAHEKFVAYYRVSTKKQGRSGLGLEAQEERVLRYLNGGGRQLAETFTEIESGRNDARPELANAIDACRAYKASLIVSTTSRLGRDAASVLGLIKQLQESGISFIAADRPGMGPVELGIHAVIDEDEARKISERTKAALAAAKARGTKLGNPKNLRDEHRAKGRRAAAETLSARADQHAAALAGTIKKIQASGATSLRAIARELERRGVPTARGRASWTPASVSNVLRRIG